MKIYSLQTETIKSTNTSITTLKVKITKEEQQPIVLEIIRLLIFNYCVDATIDDSTIFPLNRVITVSIISTKGTLATQIKYRK